MLSASSMHKFGKAVASALSPECGALRSVLAIQKRNQCRHEDGNAQMKQYDEQDSQFSDQELNLFKKLFLKYDRDENCKLDRWEFNQFAKFLVGRSYNSIDLEKVLRRVDENRDGYVTYPELMHHFGRKFKPQQKDRVAIAFNFFDKDNDGRLEFWETKQAVFYLGEDILAKQMRYKFDTVDTDQDGKLTWVFSQLDSNGDGFLNWNEIMTPVMKRYLANTEASLRESFQEHDRDGDGLLRYWETKMVMEEIGMDKGFNKELFNSIDRNSDNLLSFDEFADYVMLRKYNTVLDLKNVGRQ